MVIAPARLLLPGNRAPHAAIALCNPDIGDTVSYFPVARWIERQRRRKACRQKYSGICYSTQDVSWAVQHDLDLCFSRCSYRGGKTPHCAFPVDEAANNRSM